MKEIDISFKLVSSFSLIYSTIDLFSILNLKLGDIKCFSRPNPTLRYLGDQWNWPVIKYSNGFRTYFLVLQSSLSSALKMYRATYSYEGHQEHTLDFIEGDQFTVMDTRDQYWWLVQNGFGEIGYVPANYLEADEVRYTIALRSAYT